MELDELIHLFPAGRRHFVQRCLRYNRMIVATRDLPFETDA